jgi:hypothetical protein
MHIGFGMAVVELPVQRLSPKEVPDRVTPVRHINITDIYVIHLTLTSDLPAC